MEKHALFSGESVNVEYKVAVPGSSEKYMKTVVAYANGHGGRIVFGVDDKSLEVVGMDTDHIFQTIDAITNAISDSCEPRIIPDVTLQTVEDKTVIVVEIAPGKMRPYYIRSKGMVNGTYVRSAGTTRPVADYMLKELILEGQNRYYDCEICEDLTVTPEDIERLCAEMTSVQFLRVKTGHILQTGGSLKVPFRIRWRQLSSMCWRRSTAGCGFRACLEPGNIQVAIYDDRLEVTSPGMLLNGVSIRKMKEGYSKPRNRAIAYAFAYMKIIEKWGSGIPRMLRECSKYGLPELELIDFDGDFRVNMYRHSTEKDWSHTDDAKRDTNDTISENDTKVLNLIRENPSITQAELKEKLQVSIVTVKRLMDDLQRRGVIERQDSNRKGKWIIIGQ